MRNNEERFLGIKKPEDTNVVNNSLSFVMPTEYVTLPSKGKFYPVGHPLRDKNSIEIKQMTAKEEDILTSDNYIKKGVTLDKLLESIVLDKSINIDSICLIDKSAILVAARISAYGSEYKAQIDCVKCGEKNKINYDLINGPKVNYNESLALSENGTFTLTLPTTQWNVECKLLNGEDEKRNLNDESTENVISKQLSSIIYSINDVTDKKIIQQAIDVLPIKDSRYLRLQYKDLIPKYKFAFNLQCKCGNEEELEVPVTLEFFWPQ